MIPRNYWGFGGTQSRVQRPSHDLTFSSRCHCSCWGHFELGRSNANLVGVQSQPLDLQTIFTDS